MKYSVILIITAVILLGSCGKKCNISNPYSYSLDTTLTAYFGMYKVGSYWVYQNQNQTQKDSVYVSSYFRGFLLDRPDCESDETLLITLKSTGHNIVVNDSACILGFYNDIITQNCASSVFLNTGLADMEFYADTITGDSPTFISSSVTLNNETYKGTLFAICGPDTLYMQKQVGVIGWRKNGQTFNLVRHYLHP